MKIKSLPISKIVVKGRIRSDLGDVEEFAARIKERGLAQPIAVNHRDSGYHLIWGERRLIAYQSLGKTKMDCRVYENLTDEECVLLEIAENKDRKQFTDDECKKVVAYIERCTPPYSIRGAAEHLGVPASTYQGMRDKAQGRKRDRKPKQKESAESVLFTEPEAVAQTEARTLKPQRPDAASRLTPLQSAVYELKRAGGAKYLLDVSEQGKYALCDSLNACIEDLKAMHREMRAALVQVRVERKPLLKPAQQKKGR